MQEELFVVRQEPILTVSQLTQRIKGMLEGAFDSIWVTGEISNFRPHSSGHFYFTLKDANAQLSAVMFRGSNRLLKFRPEDGMEVIANGRISVYEVRGNYQIILETLEPKGVGALQIAFEQLKNKLAAEGLFDRERKRALPYLPHSVGIVTSPTGAAIRDMIQVLRRRAPQINILLHPVSVQGESAAPEIAAAIENLNRHGEADVLIVGRGGGSLEDLWAFNTETVARAIYASRIPVVSAIGHETDVTIADFVADLRAPTPSAAAELVAPVTRELVESLRETKRRLLRRCLQVVSERRQNFKFWLSHLKHPKKRLEEMQQHLDDLSTRLGQAMRHGLKDRRNEWQRLGVQLNTLSPLATLSRGYSIVRKADTSGIPGKVLTAATQANIGDSLEISLKEGRLAASVTGTKK